MMNFKECVFNTEEDLTVKVGTEGGSGFFYCGRVADLKENFEEIGENLLQIDKDRVTETENLMKRIKAKNIAPNEWVTAMYRRKGEFGTFDGYMEMLKQWFTDLEKVRIRLLDAKEQLKEAKPLSERTIVDAYKSIDEKATLIIIIEGRENGQFWTTEEYEGGGIDE